MNEPILAYKKYVEMLCKILNDISESELSKLAELLCLPGDPL